MWLTQRLDVGVPRVPGDVISRPRVLELLDQGAPLTVLRGACGAGKTVVLRAWAHRGLGDGSRLVWITATTDRADSAGLAGMILQRLGGADDHDLDIPAGWHAVRNVLADLEEPVTIVLDDAAILERNALEELCETVAASPRLRVVAASNRQTVLDSDGMALLVDRSVIGPLELMFDEEEVRRALDVDAAAARKILSATNGFPAIIHAMARYRAHGGEEPLADAALTTVAEYMRIRIARSGYDPELISAFLKVSFADAVDVPLARDLAGDARVESFLDDAETYGFGSWSGQGSGRMFRFAPFARELLRRELERRHGTELPELRRTYAEWALAHGRPMVALRVAVDGGDLPLARRVVMASWYELLNHGMGVRAILGPIPLARLREEPLLVMLLAICYNGVRVRRVRGLQLFRVAVSAANSQRSDLDTADRLFIWVAESVALRVLGMHERAATVAVRALRLLIDTPEDQQETYAGQVPLLCAQLGISLYYGGSKRQAIECFAYGAALAAAGVHEHAISNLAMLSGIHALDGDLPEARHYIQLIRDGGWGSRYLDGYRGTFYRIAEAILALEDGDTERAAEHVTAFEAHRATSEHWLTMAVVEMLVSLRLDRPAMASARLESFVQLRGREGHGTSARRVLSRPRAILHLAQGNTEAAKAVLQKDAPEDRFETLVERARIALVDDRPRDTLRILSQPRTRPTAARVRAEASTLRTAALLRTGNDVAADQEARQLGALLDDRELTLPLALLPPMDGQAVWALLHDRDLSAIGPVESALPHSTARPALTERELIVLRALPSGKPLTAIATDLGVSPNTVKTQVKSVYRKLGVAGREEAVAAAVSRHLLFDHG